MNTAMGGNHLVTIAQSPYESYRAVRMGIIEDAHCALRLLT